MASSNCIIYPGFEKVDNFKNIKISNAFLNSLDGQSNIKNCNNSNKCSSNICWYKTGNTPLTFAAKQRDSNLLRIFLDITNMHNINSKPLTKEKMLLLEHPSDNHETPLFHAIEANNLKNLKLLLICQANYFYENANGQRPIDIAYLNNNWGAVLLLLQHGSPFPKNFSLKDIPLDQYELLEFSQTADYFSSLIAKGETKQISELINNGILKHEFKNLNNQSAIIIAFLNHQVETYAFLKMKGFKEHWYENPIDINQLSVLEKLILKNIMASFIRGTSRLPI